MPDDLRHILNDLRDLDKRSNKHEWEISALKDRQAGLERRVTVNEEALDRIVDQSEIANAVADALKRQHVLVLSYWQKFAVGFAATLGVTATMLGIVASLRSLGVF